MKLPKLSTALRQALEACANPADAMNLQRFFKTGPGEYGAGDLFRGIRVPELRRLVPAYADLPLPDVVRLLRSKYHEDRLFALLLLVRRFERGDDVTQRRVFDLYLKNTGRINNWDLVDLSAPNIMGAWTAAHGTGVLDRLVQSSILWERRMAMVATLTLIRQKRYAPTLALAEQLLKDPEDLLHKATGWMLREVGKRDKDTLTRFLDSHARCMPRTMLRYAIERFPDVERQMYLRKSVVDILAAKDRKDRKDKTGNEF